MAKKQKFGVTVIGHRKVQAKRVPDRCRIEMRGTEVAGLKVEFVVDESERELYPYGAKGVLQWDEQQTLELVEKPADEAAPPAVASR